MRSKSLFSVKRMEYQAAPSAENSSEACIKAATHLLQYTAFYSMSCLATVIVNIFSKDKGLVTVFAKPDAVYIFAYHFCTSDSNLDSVTPVTNCFICSYISRNFKPFSVVL